MGTLAAKKQRIENWAFTETNPNRWQAFVSFQESHKAQHGTYCQLLCTHNVKPVGDEKKPGDRLNEKPIEKPGVGCWSWAEVQPPIVGAPVESDLSCHIYTGPLGSGFFVVAEFDWTDGLTYRKAKQHGPDASFGHDWIGYDPTVPA